ncbi:MAG: hypothetical protein H0U13_10995 [Gemmatimonadaceae bacterium]|nr:hypothetical protein [Gemmatimonadaceae bacterium]
MAVAGLVGCGSVKDAGFADAAPIGDAGPDADETGNATVVTQAALFGGMVGVEVGAVDIVSMTAANTVLEAKQTDASGNATIKVAPGGTVTAIYKHTTDQGADLITWVGVKPGDTLKFGNRNPTFAGMNTQLGSQTYAWPAQGGVTSYFAATSCSFSSFGNALSGVMNEASFCHREPMDVLYLATTNNILTHYNFRQNVAFTNGGTVSINSWAAAVNATVNITGMPPEVTNLSGRFAVVMDNATTERAVAGGGSFTGAPSGGAFTGNFSWSPTGERTVASLTLNRSLGNFFQMRVLDSLPASATSWTVASAQLPPWLERTFLSSTSQKLASWVLVPDAGSAHDAVMLGVQWWFEVAGTNHPHQWNFIMPPGTTTMVFPKLPSQFADFMPHTQDFMNLNALRAIEIPTVTNYDAIRAMPAQSMLCVECAVRAGEIQRAITSGS